MKIGFTGTQSGMTDWQKIALGESLQFFKATEFCHGDCIGADLESAYIALDIGIKVFTIYPPLDGKKRAWCFNLSHERMDLDWHNLKITGGELNKDFIIQVKWMPMNNYLERNKNIVKDCDYIIACPKEHTHTLRSGTWATIRYAWKLKKGITIIPPIKRED